MVDANKIVQAINDNYTPTPEDLIRTEKFKRNLSLRWYKEDIISGDDPFVNRETRRDLVDDLSKKIIKGLVSPFNQKVIDRLPANDRIDLKMRLRRMEGNNPKVGKIVQAINDVKWSKYSIIGDKIRSAKPDADKVVPTTAKPKARKAGQALNDTEIETLLKEAKAEKAAQVINDAKVDPSGRAETAKASNNANKNQS
jgi:hypothetical protein